MTAEQLDAIKWFFAFRQTSPRPPGVWVAQGPYDSYEQAKTAREGAKAWDAEVSVPFGARTKAEAQSKCDGGQFF
jgi:hypothetical protein